MSIDPGRRPTAAGLEAQLAAPAPSADLAPSSPAPQLPVKAEAARVDARTPRMEIPIAYVLAGIAVLAGVVWSGVHFMHVHARLAQPAPAAEISSAASDAGASAGAAGAAAGAGTAAGTAGPGQAPARVVATPTSPPAAVTAARTGPVLHEEMPRVSRSALATIHGRIKVEVRVAVNEAGNVTAATLKDTGPSSYFAHTASEAAKAWRFAPATGSQPRKWLLRFEFARSGVVANAAAIP